MLTGRTPIALAAMVLGLTPLAGSLQSAEEPAAMRAAEDLLARGQFELALQFAGEALKSDTCPAEAWDLHARCSAALGDHQTAVADYDQLLKQRPESAVAYDARGAEKFMLGQFAASIADFDRAIELRPGLERGHWRRGISYYYAGRFADGQKQFEGYQQVDGNDVENAVWRFLCMARAQGVEKARKEILPIRHDGRVPMMQIYALYAGKGTEQDVLDATEAGNPAPANLNARQFYAELYLGLYAEATGDRAAAQRHIAAAETHKIPHYMWDVARVHAQQLKPAAAEAAKP